MLYIIMIIYATSHCGPWVFQRSGEAGTASGAECVQQLADLPPLLSGTSPTSPSGASQLQPAARVTLLQELFSLEGQKRGDYVYMRPIIILALGGQKYCKPNKSGTRGNAGGEDEAVCVCKRERERERERERTRTRARNSKTLLKPNN